MYTSLSLSVTNLNATAPAPAAFPCNAIPSLPISSDRPTQATYFVLDTITYSMFDRLTYLPAYLPTYLSCPVPFR